MLPFVVSWFPPRGVVVSTLWCLALKISGVPFLGLVCGLKLDWKCCPSWCRGFHPRCRGFHPVVLALFVALKLD